MLRFLWRHAQCAWLSPRRASYEADFLPRRNSRNQFVHCALMDASTAHGWRLNMSLGTILLIILVIALLGGFSGLGGGPFYGTGYYGGGGLGLVLVIVLILVLLGRI
jgi:Protein of unknown function (DUF3309)